MAVTNSLFMLACPPLFHLWTVPARGPYNKRSGGCPLRCEGPTTAPPGRAESKYITATGAVSYFRRRLLPLAGALNERYEAGVGVGFGDGFFNHFLADIQVDVAWRTADVAEVGISHFTWAIDQAAQDRGRA